MKDSNRLDQLKGSAWIDYFMRLLHSVNFSSYVLTYRPLLGLVVGNFIVVISGKSFRETFFLNSWNALSPLKTMVFIVGYFFNNSWKSLGLNCLCKVPARTV